ncbi:MAG TPA: hypothetical protein PLI09_20365 [Candidatus Hydrogenedentes bacterium]|nr:hypothetical protein [Candidatus Hydrogenedentota bacterium]
MTNKKKTVLAGGAAAVSVACVAVVIVGYVSAPRAKGPSELTLHPENQEQVVAERRALELKERLALTEEQTRQVADMFTEFRKEIREVRKENPGGALGSRIPAMRERAQQMGDQIRGILTEDQRKKFDEQRADRMQRLGAVQQLLGDIQGN